jgi:hypothetical protein
MDSCFRRNDGRGVRLSLLGFCGQEGRALAPPGFPLGRGEDAEEKARRGARMDARAFAVRPRTACQRTSGAASRSHAGRDARVTAAVRVPFSLVTFSWASKRK